MSFAHLSKQVLVEELKEKTITEVEILALVEEEGDTWMTPIFEYLTEETLPANVKKARAVRQNSQRFAVLNGTLYKKSFLRPWLRCVGPLQANYVLREIHEGSYSMHASIRSVVAKALRISYYWPTMHKDARTLIRACQDCQGIDIAGPFLEGPGKVKILIVAIDYFTKWIEAKPVATITGNQIKVGSDELVFYAEKSEKSKNKQFAHAISVIDFSKDEPFSGSTTNHFDALPPSSSPVKTSEILEEFVIDEDIKNKNPNVLDSDEPVLLNSPLSDKVESSNLEGDIDEIDAFLAMEISTSRSQENVHANLSLIIESLPVSLIPVEDNDPVQEEIDIFLVTDDLIPPGVENDDSEDEDNELPNLDHQDNSSSPRPPPEPPDVCLNFKPATAMRNEDFNQGEIVLSLNVEDINSFTFVIWTFLPFFTYPEDSPVILSLRSEDLVFDPGISTFHFSLKPSSICSP
ncbi:reverse transcriptase domain-containing protein [Tanacetum coccineum]